jgi:hypothetical protein
MCRKVPQICNSIFGSPREHNIVTPVNSACLHTFVSFWTGVPMLQVLDYVVTGLLLSCAGAIGLMFFFPV